MAVIGRPAPPSKLSSSDIADNAIGTAHIQANVITHADLAPNSVTSSEMADDAVGIAELSASGTPNATSFLRGDNSWQVVDTEGTGIKSTGESGGSKFLREDGDGTSSWQEAGSPSITDNGNSNAMTIDSSENVTLVESLTTPSLKQNSNQNLSGTYSAHQLFIADGYTLTGNITVNEDIVLTKLSDDGTSITLTTDGNSQTITGTGSIESSTLAQTPVTSIVGMTGELGSGITLSNSLQDSITRLGTVTSGTINSSVANSAKNGPWFSAKYNTSAGTISASHDTYTAFANTLLFEFDEWGLVTSISFSGSNKRYTPPVAGYYWFVAQCAIDDVSDGAAIGTSLWKNGSNVRDVEMRVGSGSGTKATSCHTIEYMNGTSDYMEARVKHNDGNTRTIIGNNYSFFAGYKIGL